MPNAIFGRRFIGFEKGGWHRIGTVITEPMGAVEALQEMGDYTPYLVPARIAINGQLSPSGYAGIVRPRLPDDPEERLFGLVKANYRLVTPREFCVTADKVTKQRGIETIGVLNKGASLFLCYALPEIGINGDEHQVYLTLTNDMSGKVSLRLFLSMIRSVCENTVEAGWISASEQHRIRHGEYVLEDMAHWFEQMIGRVEAKAAVLKETFEVLAKTTLGLGDLNEVLFRTYPHRDYPLNLSQYSSVRAAAIRLRIDQENDRRGRYRSLARQLAQGAATGFEHPNMQGTAYGAYQSIVEVEDWRKGPAKESALIGSRAATKAKAFREIAQLTGLSFLLN